MCRRRLISAVRYLLKIASITKPIINGGGDRNV